MQFIDTHLHLDDEAFDTQREDVLARAMEAGISRMITIGTTAASSEKSVQLANLHKGLYAAVGIQPNYCAEAKEEDWDRVLALLDQPRVVALGETGLDRYWDHAPFELQQDYFDRHLRLSQKIDLPFIVHMRDCGSDIVTMLTEARSRGPLRGVMHSFTGDVALAEECLALGLHISFAGMLTFKKSEELRSVAATIPADRLLIETDAPYLSPHPKRSQRPNEPSLVVLTAQCLADARNESLESIAAITTQNGEELFRL